MVAWPWPGRVVCRWTSPPGAKVPSSFMPNQEPNSSALASARHTRERGARRTISSSMRSVVLCNFMVASYYGTPLKRNRLIAYIKALDLTEPRRSGICVHQRSNEEAIRSSVGGQGGAHPHDPGGTPA